MTRATSITDLPELIDAVVRGETNIVARLLTNDPTLATMQCGVGGTRQQATDFFFEEIHHYLYAGDTALHMAAAAFRRSAAELLIERGANCRARNRRGAEPLHYAADTNTWNPAAQRDTIECLLAAGADPNALDKSGVAALHRAVRTRGSDAVRALLAGGADVRARNGSGSTPLHLAVQDTGRGGAGSERARSEQEKIIALLLDAGARPTDKNSSGISVRDTCAHERIRTLLERAR